jgi:hypothetical protein
MNYASRFFLYAPLGVVVVLGAVIGLHWQAKAAALSKRLDAINGHEVMPGVTVSFASKEIRGFPFNLDTALADFSIMIATPKGPTRWRSEKFAMHALTYGRDETIFEAAGRQHLQWQGGALDFAVGALHASAILKSGSLTRFDLDLVGFGSKAFTAARLQLHARKSGDTAQIYVAADGLTKCPALRYSATLSHQAAFTALLSGEQAWPAAIATWRRDGGHATDGRLAALHAEDVLDPGALATALCR